MLRLIVKAFAARPSLTISAWLLVSAFGVLSYTTLMPREGFPQINLPIAVVGGAYFVDDAETVDAEITRPLAEALTENDEIEQVQSFAQPNGFSLVVNFDDAVNPADGVQIIEDTISTIELPSDAQIAANMVQPAKFIEKYDLLVSVSGPVGTSPADLQATAEKLLDRFATSDAIDQAETVELITSAVNPATGELLERQTQFNLFTAKSDDGVTFRPSIAIGMIAADGIDALEIRDATDERLEQVTAEGVLPDGYNAVVAIDFATQIRQQIASLQSNVLTGIIAVSILALLLISWRASAITAIFVATVLATSVGVLYLFGITLNTVSLFGIILALGLLVDDAIVITESIAAARRPELDELATIDSAISRVGAASLSGTITTVLVFAPMLAITGILGSFIRILPISVMTTLLVSVTMSFIFIPVAARYIILRNQSRGVLAAAEERVADAIASLTRVDGKKGWVRAGLAVGLSIVMTLAGLLVFAPQVGFDIFPPQTDSNFVNINLDFAPGTPIEEAEAKSLAFLQEASDSLGDTLDQGYLYIGNERSALGQLNLTPMGSRPAAKEIIEDKLTPLTAGADGFSARFSQVDAGPPDLAFPFLTQIYGEDPQVLAAAGAEVRAALEGAVITRPNGTTFNVLETQIVFVDSVARTDGRRLVEVRARFDAEDVTTVTAQTREFLEAAFPAERLEGLSLAGDALEFDLGFESDNQESFASMPFAFGIALLSMFLLLVIQFRSSVQWVLVFLAIPFSFFGVFGGLLLTGNLLSFFAMLGLIGLVGIAVNNTILLTDYANQERRAGHDARTAIQRAVRQRFRPLVTTSLTTVAGLTPLALSDPFWEALAFTIIFGLLSSTFLVLVAFPFYYLGIESLRDRFVTPWRRSSNTIHH